MNFFNTKNGFSLLELMLVVALVGIGSLLIVPTMRDLIVKNRTTVEVDKIVTALRFARSAAIELGEIVTFCKSKDRKECCHNCNWSDGQILITNGGNVLRIIEPPIKDDLLEWRGNLGRNDSLRFLPTGTTDGQQGDFYYCPKGLEKYVRIIVINMKGRVYIRN